MSVLLRGLHVILLVSLFMNLSGLPLSASAQPVAADINAIAGQETGIDSPFLADVTAQSVAAGGIHSCALTASGGVKCWGYNTSGQLGDGSGTNHSTPVDVSGLTNLVTSLASGSSHSCAVVSGRTKCWGSNTSGQIGNGAAGTPAYVPTDVVGAGLNVKALALGGAFSCALTSANGVKCWGYNAQGQLGIGSTATQLTAVDVSGLTSGVKMIAAGASHTCAVLDSGAVKCWGNNINGQLGDSSNINRSVPTDVSGLSSGVSAIAARGGTSCALLADGSVKCWGQNDNGQLGDDSLVNRSTPVSVMGLEGSASGLALGSSHACALLADGGMQCWGNNGNGQLGDGTIQRKTIPIRVQGLGGVVTQISNGDVFSCARLSNGGLQCWGYNFYGSLGDGTTTQRTFPVNTVGFGPSNGNQPQISLFPASVPADGSATIKITVYNAAPTHQVRLSTSRGSLDSFSPATGTTSASGVWSTTVKSSSPGHAVLYVTDITNNSSVTASAMLTFSDPGGTTLPPAPVGSAPVITKVSASLPLDARYFEGLSALNPIIVSVDWRGANPGKIEYAINGVATSVNTASTVTPLTINMDGQLRPGTNTLSFTAISAQGGRSAAQVFSPLKMALPDWLQALKVANLVGQHVFTNVATETEFKIPKNGIKLGGGPAELQFNISGKSKLSLRCGDIASLSAKGGGEIKSKLKDIELGGKLTVSGEITGAVVNCWIPTAEGDVQVELTLFGEKSWPLPIFIAKFVNPAAGQAMEELIGSIGIGNSLDIFGSIYVRGEISGFVKSGVKLIPQDPYAEWQQMELGLGLKPEAGYEFKKFGVELKSWLSLSGQVSQTIPTIRDFELFKVDAYTIVGEGGFEFKPPMLNCKYARVYNITYAYDKNKNPADSTSVELKLSQECSLFKANQAKRSPAIFLGTADSLQAFQPDVYGLQQVNLAKAALAFIDPQTVTSTLVSNVYRYAAPSLAVNPTNNQAVMVWTHDDTTKPVWQSQEIAFSLWNGTAWSTPANITADAYLDSDPEVAWTADGKAVAIWQRLPLELDSSAVWDTTTAKKIELAASTFDPTLGTWTAPALVTSNTALDINPQLARSPSGALLLAWKQNDAGMLNGGAVSPDRLMTSFYTTGWSAPVAAAEGLQGMREISAAYADTAAMLAFVQDVTPPGGTPTAQVFTTAWDGTNWSAPVQQTTGDAASQAPRLVYNAAKQPMLVWLAGGSLSLRNLTSQAAVLLALAEDVGTVDEFKLVEDTSGNLAAVFTAQTAVRRDLYLAFYDQINNVWGSPRKLTDDSASESSPSPALDSTGRLLAGFTTTAQTSTQQAVKNLQTGEPGTVTLAVDGQTDLITLSHLFNRNLLLSASDLSVSNPLPQTGQSITMTARVHNTGDLALAGVSVSFYNGNPSSGGVKLGTASLNLPLPGQASADLSIDYTFTGSALLNLYAVADPNNAIVESSETDNTANLKLFQPDLAVSAVAVEYWGGQRYGLKATITNLGAGPAAASTLRFAFSATPAVYLVTAPVPALAGGESTTLILPWESGALASGSYPLTAKVDPLPAGEADLLNNQAAIALDVRADLSVSPYAIWVKDWKVNPWLVTVQVFNTGTVDAAGVVVNLYNKPGLDSTGLIATETISVPAGGSTTIDLAVSHTTGCELYVYANPEGSVQETTRENNLALVIDPALDATCLSNQKVFMPILAH